MKRHAIYFALALAERGVYPPGSAVPAMPDPSLPVSHFITQVNADKSITHRLFAPDARRVSIVTGATPELLCLARHDQSSGRSLDMEKRADGLNLYEYYFDVDGFRSVDTGSRYQKPQRGEHQFDSGARAVFLTIGRLRMAICAPSPITRRL